jgi:DUF1680 family protein
MLEALRWHAEATGDARVVPFLTRYARHQRAHLPTRPLHFWAQPRGGDNLETVQWLYDRSGEGWLLELGDLLHAQTSDWIGELGGDGAPNEEFDFGHGVNRAMGMKEPALWSRRSGDRSHLAAVRHGWERVMAQHGQVQGLYSCDEFLHGRAPTQGIELCTVVELLSSFSTVLRVGGEAWAADAMERLACNALPAILAADHCSHQYFQLANQIECTPGNRAFSVPHGTDLLFGLATGYGCCAANLHMGWPRLAAHLWLAAPGELCAPLFAPCRLTTAIDGVPVRIDETTAYPFADDIVFTIRTPAPVTFTLTLRIPAWCEQPAVELPAGAPALRPRRGSFHSIRATWRDGDTVRLHLPAALRATDWDGGIAVERGPLVFALPIDEEWRPVAGTPPFADYEVHPTTRWNYALAIDPAAPQRSMRVESRPAVAQPWSPAGTPLVLHTRARRVPAWTVHNGVAGPLPEGAFATTPTEEAVRLIPFGAARLRISVLPVVPGRS